METPADPKTWQMGLGKLSDWANLCACGVMFFLFYQAQQNAFEMYRVDKVETRDSMRMLWQTTRDIQQDSIKQTEQLRQLGSVMLDMQRVNAETLIELKRLKTVPPGKVE